MSDRPDLLFKKVLGSLRPANTAAEEALKAIDGTFRVELKRTRGNQRRMGLYWSCLSIAAPMLAEKAPGLTVELLHKVLKDRAGLVRVVTLPSGQEVRDYDSISFAKMTEDQRSQYVTAALAMLSTWLGCPVEDLRREGEAA